MMKEEGIYKLLTFPGSTSRGIFTYLLNEDSGHLTKTASEYHPEIAAYINSAKKIPGKTQLLLTALGAGEWWGSNVNGDYFAEDQLAYPGEEYGYRTFLKMAKVYKHHVNKDPNRSYGDVVMAVYNPKYHRVELIVSIDNAKAPDIVARINAGDFPEWSMGCRVPYDICSVCGHKAKKREEYCDHLKYYMNQIDPETGKKCYAINIRPKFFDISYVLIGADKTAKTLLKVASVGGALAEIISSAYQFDKLAGAIKESEIKKEVPVDPGGQAPDSEEILNAITELKAREPLLPKDMLDGMAKRHRPGDILSSMMMMGILPKPREVQRIVIISVGKPEIADKLDKDNIVFDPAEVNTPSEKVANMISRHHFNEDIMGGLLPYMEDRSSFAPLLYKRMVRMTKCASNPEPIPNYVKLGGFFNSDDEGPEAKDAPASIIAALPYMALAATLYTALGKKAPIENLAGIERLIAKHPGLAVAASLGTASALNQLLGPGTRGTDPGQDYQPQPEVGPIYDKTASMIKSAFLGSLGWSGKELLFGPTMAYMTSKSLQKRRASDPYYQEGGFKKFVRKHPDVVSGLIAADALASLSGGGSRGLIGKGWKSGKNLVKMVGKVLIKKGSSESETKRFLSHALVWPLAFGKAGLPGRVMGGLMDYGASKGISKLIDRGAKKPLSKTIKRTTI